MPDTIMSATDTDTQYLFFNSLFIVLRNKENLFTVVHNYGSSYHSKVFNGYMPVIKTIILHVNLY